MRKFPSNYCIKIFLIILNYTVKVTIIELNCVIVKTINCSGNFEGLILIGMYWYVYKCCKIDLSEKDCSDHVKI